LAHADNPLAQPAKRCKPRAPNLGAMLFTEQQNVREVL